MAIRGLVFSCASVLRGPAAFVWRGARMRRGSVTGPPVQARGIIDLPASGWRMGNGVAATRVGAGNQRAPSISPVDKRTG